MKDVAGGTPAASVTVSVITRSDLTDDTDETGYFEITSVPEGNWCIHASFESDGRGHEFALCIDVAATAGVDVGERVAAEESTLTCSSNDDCPSLHDLPAWECTSSLDLELCNLNNSCHGYVCRDSVCTYDAYDSSTDGDDTYCGETQIISGTHTDARSGYNGLCEETSACTSDADCPTDASCL